MNKSYHSEKIVNALFAANDVLYRYNAMINREKVPDKYGVGDAVGRLNEALDTLPEDLIKKIDM